MRPLIDRPQIKSKVGAAAEGGWIEKTYTLTVPDSSSLQSLLSRWEQREDVRYAHPNVTYSVHGSGDAERPLLTRDRADPPILREGNFLADSLDHLQVTRATEAWSVTAGTTDVTVGVVDTGIYTDHPDLAGQFWVNPGEDVNGNGVVDAADFNGVDDDGNGYVDDVRGYDFVDRPGALAEGEYTDPDPRPAPDPKGTGSGHGTAVAGVISAMPGNASYGAAGVAPRTQLVPLRAFGGDGRGAADDIASAILYAATMDIDVLNLSFGRARSVPLIEDAIEYASEQGTVIVGSAGNEPTDAPHYPSDHPEVVSVIWFAEDGEGLPRVSQSQYGIGADVGAPGTNVFTTAYPRESIRAEQSPSREDLYDSVNGSSFSAPQVAGAAALLRSVADSLRPASIRTILTSSARDVGGEGWDHTTASGLLDVRRSVLNPLPSQIRIAHPDHNAGFQAQGPVPITGSVLHPSFERYTLYYAEGIQNLDTRPSPWTEITDAVRTQALRDTLGRWEASSLPEGAYTLRLVATLAGGETVEERRRVTIDRTPPSLGLRFLGHGRVNGHNGIIADVTSDDPIRLRMQVRRNGTTTVRNSETVGRRLGVTWADDKGQGGEVQVSLTATNRAGMETARDTTLSVPPDQTNTALLRRMDTDLPAGRLLPQPTDFDGDGLRALVMNPYREGGLSDSLVSFEWRGDGFVAADSLAGRFIPKDVGDTNGDGQQELLLQRRESTLLLEQQSDGDVPTRPIFVDTTGSSDPPFIGTRLSRFDDDETGEILGNTRSSWVFRERQGGGFQPAIQLENPTGGAGRDSSALTNAFGTAEALVRDFDGDDQQDLLVGDRDGDLILYEVQGDDAAEVAWTHETSRVDSGNRFAAGDLMGTGSPEFVTMTASSGANSEGRAPSIAYYRVWTSTRDDAYESVYRVPIAGPIAADGTIATVDVDADGREEAILVHPPSLMVLDKPEGEPWRVQYDYREEPIIRSRSVVAADVSGNGTPSIFVGTTDETLSRFVVDQQALAVTPPRWRVARPLGGSSSRLEWRAPGADSVTVYGGSPTGSLDPVETVQDSMVVVEGETPRRVALKAWEGGKSSPLSETRVVRPHAPAVVDTVRYPGPSSVELQFSAPLDPDIRPNQFRLQPTGTSPTDRSITRNQEGIVLHFPKSVAGQEERLVWNQVVDDSGLPVGQSQVRVTFPVDEPRGLFVESVKIQDERHVQLRFNAPVASAVAEDLSRYELSPRGEVDQVTHDSETPTTVTIQTDGLLIGATGLDARLSINSMRSTSGERLASQSRVVDLSRPASDLSNVYVYPNPYRANQHSGAFTIAGVPTEATIRVLTPGGRLVDVVEADGLRDGGAKWDLRNRRGEKVPAGIYLFRVTAPDATPVLKKAAVIR